MTISLRSNVTRRDEKGMFGIPFKRLIAAGVSGGMVIATLQNVLGTASLGLAAVTVILALILTASRGGIPAWRRSLYGLQAQFLMAATRPESMLHPLARLFNVSSDGVILNGAELFGAKETKALTHASEWVVYSSPQDDLGMTLVESPTGSAQR